MSGSGAGRDYGEEVKHHLLSAEQNLPAVMFSMGERYYRKADPGMADRKLWLPDMNQGRKSTDT